MPAGRPVSVEGVVPLGTIIFKFRLVHSLPERHDHHISQATTRQRSTYELKTMPDSTDASRRPYQVAGTCAATLSSPEGTPKPRIEKVRAFSEGA